MQGPSTATLNPIVTIKDGKAFANSRDVAEFFGVLRDIDALIEGEPSICPQF